MIPELHAKMYEKITNNWLYEKRYIFETKQNTGFKIWYDNFETGIQIICQNFEFVPFELIEKEPIKEPYDRAGPSRLITDIIYMV